MISKTNYLFYSAAGKSGEDAGWGFVSHSYSDEAAVETLNLTSKFSMLNE